MYYREKKPLTGNLSLQISAQSFHSCPTLVKMELLLCTHIPP